MSISSTKLQIDMLRQIAGDPKVSDKAFRVAWVLVADYLNSRTLECHPSIVTLAADLHRSPRRAQEAVSDLLASGHFGHRRGGPGRPSRYFPIPRDKTNASDQEASTQDESVLSEIGRNRLVNEGMTGRFWQADRTESSVKTGRNRPTNRLNEPSEEPEEIYLSANPASKSAVEDEFEELWKQYPRKVAKGQALKAFKAARKKAEHTTIMAGVLRYAAERTGQDPHFTKHPATWLNGECWGDEATAHRTPSSSGRGGGSQPGKDRTLEAVQKLRAKDGAHG